MLLTNARFWLPIPVLQETHINEFANRRETIHIRNSHLVKHKEGKL